MEAKSRKLFTFGGALAVVFWSSSVCVCGSLIPKLGVFTSAGLVYLLSGLMACLALLPGGKLKSFKSLSLRRLAYCGMPFVLYIVFFYLATGMAKDGRQLIEIGLLNYLWPALALLFSLPLQGNKASLLLPVGVLLGVSGMFMASCSFNGGFGLGVFFSDLASSPLPYALAFAGAVLWGVYCNLTKLLEAESTPADIPAFMLLSGLLLLPVGSLLGERPSWDLGISLALLATALMPGFLACVLWDAAARRGDFVFVSVFAYLAPVFSTLMTGLLFEVPLTAGVWAACLLVVVGAALCHVSIKRKPAEASAALAS